MSASTRVTFPAWFTFFISIFSGLICATSVLRWIGGFDTKDEQGGPDPTGCVDLISWGSTPAGASRLTQRAIKGGLRVAPYLPAMILSGWPCRFGLSCHAG